MDSNFTAVLEKLRSSLSAFQIISRYTSLKRAGSEYRGLCPFHKEKSPSFYVNDEDGLYNCFGCGKKGDLINFLMEISGQSFMEVVRDLAKEQGIELPRSEAARDEKSIILEKQKESLQTFCDNAASFYATTLQEASQKNVRDYLQSRGVTDNSVKSFALGFCPRDPNALTSALLKQHSSAQVGQTSGAHSTSPYTDAQNVFKLAYHVGLVNQTRSEDDQQPGRIYNTLGGRLIFPIRRNDGRTIAFGGRVLPNAPGKSAKYLNTKESLVYQKKRNLYGIDQAIATIRKIRTVIIVEGYLDVILMHQAGFCNTVACCGTSLGEDHSNIIKRLANKAILMFDGDTAGINSAARAFEVFINSGVDLNICLLPSGEDPASMCVEGRIDDLNAVMADSKNAFSAYLDSQLQSQDGESTSPARLGKVAEHLGQLISRVINPVERDILINISAERIGVSQSSIASLVTEQIRINRSVTSMPERRNPYSKSAFSNTAFSNTVSSRTTQSKTRSLLQITNRTTNQMGDQPPIDFYEEPHSSSSTLPLLSPSLVKQLNLLLVALLREPALIAKLAPISHLLPRQVLQFTEQLQSASFAGLDNLAKSDAEPRTELDPRLARDSSAETLKSILSSAGFSAQDVIAEARHQQTLGGTNSQKVVEGFVTFLEKKSFQSTNNPPKENSSLRDQVQQKLERRKSFETRFKS